MTARRQRRERRAARRTYRAVSNCPIRIQFPGEPVILVARYSPGKPLRILDAGAWARWKIDPSCRFGVQVA